MSDLAQRARRIIARVLKVDAAGVKDGDMLVQDLGATSIQSIELVAAFEEEFDITMDEDEALGVKSVGEAVEYLRKIVEKDSE